jgi:phage terminase large subunit
VSEVEIKFPRKMQGLFQPNRYKILYGGRGSGKSWGVARALLLLGAQMPLRILCAREVQKSIKNSVHKLLADQIQVLGLGSFYQVLETEIRGANGTEFFYSGLAQHTVETVKSFEGANICWCEEAQTISKKSWNILIPTIRAAGSEIWITFNPDLDTDETYVRFVVDPPTGAFVQLINWQDNPHFTDELEYERAECEQKAPKDYPNIWGGQCRKAVAGAIYAEEIEQCDTEKRITLLPYDASLKVHVVVDLGWNDCMAIALVQKHYSGIRVIKYIEDSHKTLDDYNTLLRSNNYNWGTLYLPHDGKAGDYKTGKTAQELMEEKGWKVEITPSLSVEAGIKLAREIFRQFVFDKESTERLVQCLKRYRRTVHSQTQQPMGPLHDEFSHGADVFRYIAINAESMSNENFYIPQTAARYGDTQIGY